MLTTSGRRVPAASMLDELCTAGDVVWLGRRCDRVGRQPCPAVLYRPDRPPAPSWERARSAAVSLFRHGGAARAGWRKLLVQLRAGAIGPTDAELLAAPVGSRVGGRGHRRLAAAAKMTTGSGGGAACRAVAARGAGAARRGSARIGPAQARGAGVWSPRARAPSHRPRHSAHAAAMHRRAPRGRRPRGGAGRGRRRRVRLRVRRAQGARGPRPGAPGYFVSGLGATQFALHGAVDGCARCVAREPAFPAAPGRTRRRAPGNGGPLGHRPRPALGGTLPWPESRPFGAHRRRPR